MSSHISREVALSLCRKIREENRARPVSPEARQSRRCEACCGSRVMKGAGDGGRPCCQINRRYASLLPVAL